MSGGPGSEKPVCHYLLTNHSVAPFVQLQRLFWILSFLGVTCQQTAWYTWPFWVKLKFFLRIIFLTIQETALVLWIRLPWDYDILLGITFTVSSKLSICFYLQLGFYCLRSVDLAAMPNGSHLCLKALWDVFNYDV